MQQVQEGTDTHRHTHEHMHKNVKQNLNKMDSNVRKRQGVNMETAKQLNYCDL